MRGKDLSLLDLDPVLFAVVVTNKNSCLVGKFFQTILEAVQTALQRVALRLKLRRRFCINREQRVLIEFDGLL